MGSNYMKIATDQAENLAAFTGLLRTAPNDRFFLVLGMTGAGKSTFISRCTGTDVTIGHGLFSCTSSIDVFDFTWNGRKIYLIDTPGFNDTNRSDSEALGILASYLGASYGNGVPIHGILLLHPISDNRMSGTSLRNIEMMKAMCGYTKYNGLAIATTMWPETPSSDDMAILEGREHQLMGNNRFFGDLMSQGASVFRHNGKGKRDPFEEKASALHIMEELIKQSDLNAPQPLRLQQEIFDEQKTLGDTAAGMAVAGELYKARQVHETQLRELEKALREELAKSDAAYAADLQELKADVESKLKKAEAEKNLLKKSMQDMHRDEERVWREKIMEMNTIFEKRLASKEQELQDMQDSIFEMRKAAQRRESNLAQIRLAEAEIAEYNQMVLDVRNEVYQSRVEYQKFHTKTQSFGRGIAKDTAKGLASGAAAAGMTAVMHTALAGAVLCTIM